MSKEFVGARIIHEAVEYVDKIALKRKWSRSKALEEILLEAKKKGVAA